MVNHTEVVRGCPEASRLLRSTKRGKAEVRVNADENADDADDADGADEFEDDEEDTRRDSDGLRDFSVKEGECIPCPATTLTTVYM